MSKADSQSTRRDFLAQAAAVSAVATIPKTSFASPNDRLKIAFIGTGGRGGSNLQTIAGTNTVDVVGLCDVDNRFLTSAGNKFPEAKQFQDFRKLYDTIGDDIDAVVVSTPATPSSESGRTWVKAVALAANVRELLEMAGIEVAAF